jgi:glucokinase
MSLLQAASSYVGLEIANGILRSGRINGMGRLVARHDQPLAMTSLEALVNQLVAAVRAVDGTGDEAARAVGVAISGIVAANRVTMCANMPLLSDAPLGEELGRRLGRPVRLENDANAAAVAEAWQGAGRGGRAVLFVELGVGLGAGIVVDGRVWSGPNGYAGEIGHVQVDPNGAPCGCGLRGCLETIAGATGWMRRLRAALASRHSAVPTNGDQQAIVTAAVAGDVVALEIVAETARALGTTLAAAVGLLNLDRVVIGGGAAACPLLLDKVVAEARQRTLPRAFAECSFRLSELTDGACVLGAARVARVAMFGAAEAR